jgi:hypothetical protein
MKKYLPILLVVAGAVTLLLLFRPKRSGGPPSSANATEPKTPNNANGQIASALGNTGFFNSDAARKFAEAIASGTVPASPPPGAAAPPSPA